MTVQDTLEAPESADTSARTGTLPERFAECVRRAPGATAVVDGELSLSYAELDARADRLARRLVRLGVRPEDRIGVLMDHSADLVVAELAIAQAGAAYVPLDRRAPESRLRLLLAGCGVSVLVTDDPDRAAGVRCGQTVDIGGFIPDEDVSLPAADPERLAYLMHTSGSTGLPKGVAVRHRDVVALADDSRFTGGAHERILMHSPLAFDASTYELWVPLLNGGTVVVATGDVDVDSLRRLISRHGLTAVFLTSGLFRVFAQEAPGCFRGLREVWTGGDVVPPAAVRRVLESCPGLT